MLESRGQLAILFRNYGPGEGRIRIFNATTGEEIRTAKIDEQLGAALACFRAPYFTFIRTQDKKFVFCKAEIR